MSFQRWRHLKISKEALIKMIYLIEMNVLKTTYILVPGCPSDIHNRSEGEEGLFGRRVQMGWGGREDG